MFLLPIKLDRMSFETKGRQNLQKTADFLIESIVFCPLVPPSWISLVDPTSAMYASAIYVSYIYVHNIHAKQLTMKLPKMPTKKHAFFTHYNSNACADTDHVESIFCHDSNINSLLGVFFSRFLR